MSKGKQEAGVANQFKWHKVQDSSDSSSTGNAKGTGANQTGSARPRPNAGGNSASRTRPNPHSGTSSPKNSVQRTNLGRTASTKPVGAQPPAGLWRQKPGQGTSQNSARISSTVAGSSTNLRSRKVQTRNISAARQAGAARAKVVSTTKKGKSKPAKVQSRGRKICKRLCLSAVFLFLGCVIAGATGLLVLYFTTDIPEPSEFAVAETTNVYYGDGSTLMGTFSEINREVIDTSTLPDYVGYAVVASEDRTFYTNSGIDIKGLARALWNNLTSNSTQGGSTLSQQYVENYYVGETTTDIVGKVKEVILALKINREQSKDQILGNYLNTIYFGRGAYGIEAAAKAYFDKSAEDLTVSEAAMLAGIIPAPSMWDPALDPDQAELRWERVLELMVTDGYIDQETADAQEFPETIDPDDATGSSEAWEPYLMQQIETELINEGILSAEDLETGGYTIIATIDYELQQAAQASVEVMPEDTPDNLRIALSSIDNETGEIVAEYAGSDYNTVQTNAVTQDIAMAGSTFKPFALIPYVESGGSVWDLFDGSSPQTFYNLEVSNNENISWGYISLVTATQNSVNTVYASLNDEVGADNSYQAMIDAGIPEDTSGLDQSLLNVLGYASPHNIDITHAYATLANGGERVTPHIVRTVLDSDGNVYYTADTSKERVFDTETISAIMPALQSVTTESGTGSKVSSLGIEVAGKTGTSEDQLSAQFVGFTPSYTTTVSMYQVGEDGSSESLTNIGGLSQFHGADWPVDVWIAYMEVAIEGHEDETFDWM